MKKVILILSGIIVSLLVIYLLIAFWTVSVLEGARCL